jgi:2,4-dienoyl-CoA reductase-like NADH-dependent reductase (Old Yellow Enzyme family)
MKGKMERSIARLFEPVEAGGIAFRNRFLRSATWLAGCTEVSGEVTGPLMSRYAELAAGGLGGIISGYANVSADGRAQVRQMNVDTDDRTADVAKIATTVQTLGARLIVQVAYGGAVSNPAAVRQGSIKGPSAMEKDPVFGNRVEAMTEADIERVIGDFGAAARRVKEGGADGVQLHGAHGYLLMQFLSTVFNQRTDRWGGDFDSRSAILLAVQEEVRSCVGPDFPVWWKLSVSEERDGGYTAEDGARLAERLVEAGADGIEVSGGARYVGVERTNSRLGTRAGVDEGYFAAHAAMVKARVGNRAAVALVGGLKSPATAARLLEDGVADLFSLCRPLIAESDLVNRWAEGDLRPAECISCNACFKTVSEGIIYCPVMKQLHEGAWEPLPEC